MHSCQLRKWKPALWEYFFVNFSKFNWFYSGSLQTRSIGKREKNYRSKNPIDVSQRIKFLADAASVTEHFVNPISQCDRLWDAIIYKSKSINRFRVWFVRSRMVLEIRKWTTGKQNSGSVLIRKITTVKYSRWSSFVFFLLCWVS